MRALSKEEQALFDEMKERCLAKGQYKDEKAKDKFKMLCHLEDFMIQYWELLKENKELKEVIDKIYELIKQHIRKDGFLELNEWQTRDLLNLLKEVSE